MLLFKINLAIIRLFKDNKTKLKSNNKIINKIIFPKIKMKTFSTLKFIKIIKITLNLITQFLLLFLQFILEDNSTKSAIIFKIELVMKPLQEIIKLLLPMFNPLNTLIPTNPLLLHQDKSIIFLLKPIMFMNNQKLFMSLNNSNLNLNHSKLNPITLNQLPKLILLIKLNLILLLKITPTLNLL